MDGPTTRVLLIDPDQARREMSAKRLRAQGLRPLQIWVPDTRSPRFAAEARRQCQLIADSPFAAEDQAFVDSLATIDEE